MSAHGLYASASRAICPYVTIPQLDIGSSSRIQLLWRAYRPLGQPYRVCSVCPVSNRADHSGQLRCSRISGVPLLGMHVLYSWMRLSIVVAGRVLPGQKPEYVRAPRPGSNNRIIMFRHILPNAMRDT